jgi:hypothetical protein
MSITRPNIVQQENRLRTLPDEALRTMLLQMGQTGQVGSPEYLLAAGEMQARKNVRQQAQMGQPQQPPVIAELLSGVQMPGQQPQGQPMPMGPEEAGVAALPAQNLEALDQPQYADGGIVAFSGGNVVRNPFLVDEMDALDRMSPEQRKEYYRQKFQAREAALKAGKPAGAPASAAPRRAPMPGFFGRAAAMAPALGTALTWGWDSLYGTSDEDMEKLRAFDAAKERLKAAGFTDKDIAAMPRETIYRMASGYQPKTVPGAGAAGGTFEPVPFDEQGSVVQTPPAGDGANLQGGAPSVRPQEDGIARMLSMQKRLMGPEEAAPDFAQQARDELAGFGFDFDANKELREQVQKGMAQVDTDRQKAGWAALAQFGLTLASTPGDFRSAIGKAGLPALDSYGKEMKELNKLAREDQRLLNQLRRDDNANAMGLAGLTDKKRTSFENRRAELSRDAMRTAATIVGAEISANAPGATERLIDRFSGKTFDERAQAAARAGVIGYGSMRGEDQQVQAFLKMNPTERALLKRNDPELYAMLEAKARQALLPKPVTAPGNNAQIRN